MSVVFSHQHLMRVFFITRVFGIQHFNDSVSVNVCVRYIRTPEPAKFIRQQYFRIMLPRNENIYIDTTVIYACYYSVSFLI